MFPLKPVNGLPIPQEMQSFTLDSMKTLIESSKHVKMKGDVHCGEVKWELLKAGEGNTWVGSMLELIMNNMILQWVKDKMRCKGEYNLSRLGLILIKRVGLKRDVNYMSPLRKSNYLTKEIEMMSEVERDV